MSETYSPRQVYTVRQSREYQVSMTFYSSGWKRLNLIPKRIFSIKQRFNPAISFEKKNKAANRSTLSANGWSIGVLRTICGAQRRLRVGVGTWKPFQVIKVGLVCLPFLLLTKEGKFDEAAKQSQQISRIPMLVG